MAWRAVTLGTFAFGVVTGIRQAKRALPRRLMQFMVEQLRRSTTTAKKSRRLLDTGVPAHLMRTPLPSDALNVH